MHRFSLLLLSVVLLASCQHVPGRKATGEPNYAAAQRAPNARGGVGDMAPKRDVIADESEAVEVKKVVKVGLLLPLTGRNAELGRALQNAATVSLFDKYARLNRNQQAVRVELLPVDTGDSPDMARRAMASALSEEVELVIGPLFGDSTEAVAGLAAARNVPVLSFSNNRAKGAAPGTYLLGFSPQEQAVRVVRYAVASGKKRIGVLVPKSPLGEEVLQAARLVAKETGKVTLVEAQYAPQAVGVDAAIAKLLPAPGAAPLDALLLAESGTPLESTLRALAARGIDASNTQIMGTGMWDDAALLARTNLDGAWLASSDPQSTAEFETRFKNTYGYAPPRIASLAYDAVALAVTLATSERGFAAEHLTNPRGYVGPANGLFRLRPGSVTQRGLAVLQVQGGGLKVLSPAPQSF